jgi:hypothetical protein
MMKEYERKLIGGELGITKGCKNIHILLGDDDVCEGSTFVSVF